jgi:hypothetical protein
MVTEFKPLARRGVFNAREDVRCQILANPSEKKSCPRRVAAHPEENRSQPSE